jgi:hypothetical protein
MKKYLGIFTIALSAIAVAAYPQDNEKKETQKELEKKQQSDRARSPQGIRTDNELKDDRGEVQSNQYRKSESDSVSNQGTSQENEDQVLEKNQDQGLGSDDDGNGLTNENNTTQSGEQRTNTPAVIQSTSSESGSPAILSGGNGTERDGTNNVQRAKPNIAGAKEPGNMNLPAKNTAERNRNMGEPRIRKQEEQPGQSGTSGARQSSANTENKTQKTMDSNSAGTPRETTAPLTEKEQRKAKRKARRNN